MYIISLFNSLQIYQITYHIQKESQVTQKRQISCNFVTATSKFVSHLPVKPLLDHPVFEQISRILGREQREAYVVGGYVRDALMGRPCKDIDIVVVGSGIDLAKQYARMLGGKTRVSVFRNFGTAMVQTGDTDIEFVGARKESYRRNSRKPMVENGSLEDDLMRRDFTINTLAVALHPDQYGTLVDRFGGMDDLEKKLIRTPLNPDKTFDDDPLRMVRGIRFATQLNFHLHPDTMKAIRRNHQRIGIVSMERITEELNKIILSPKPSIGFKLLDKTQLLPLILPEISRMKGVEVIDSKQHKDNFYHTLKVLDNISRKSGNLWLRWAALLHDVGKPVTKKFDPETGWTFHAHDYVGAKMVPEIFRRLKLPLNEKMKFVRKMVRLHLRPMALVQEEVTDSAVRRLLFETGDDIDDLMTLCEADITSKYQDVVRKHQANFRMVRKKLQEIEEKDAVRNFQPPIRGEEIMKTFGIPPSKTVGVIKDAIKEAILEGEIPNRREEAWDYMLKKGREMGLKPAGADQGKQTKSATTGR